MASLPGLLAASALCTPPLSARGFAERPSLSGPESNWTSPGDRFTVHWTTAGQDAIAGAEDADGDGLPDAVGLALAGLDAGWAEAESAGYRLPPPDLAGGPGLDVYFRAIDANGYAYPSPDASDDAGTSCFLELAAGLGDATEILPSVAAHEFTHCVQFAHTPLVAGWFDEAHATWVQYRLFSSPTLDLARDVLWNQRLRGMDQAVDAVGERFEYAGLILVEHWVASGGRDAGRPAALWSALAGEPDWRLTFDAESRRIWDRSWSRTFLDFATWAFFACARDDGAHWDPATLPCTLPAVSVDVGLLDGSQGAFAIALPDVPDSARYWEVVAPGERRPVRILCDAPDADGELLVALVALDADGRGGEQVEGRSRDGEGLNLSLRHELPADGTVGVVAASVGAAPLDLACTWDRVDAEPEPSPEPDASTGPGDGGCACRVSAGQSSGRAGAGAVLALLLNGWRFSRSERSRTCLSSASCSPRPGPAGGPSRP